MTTITTNYSETLDTDDAGKVAIFYPMGVVLATGDTLADAIREWNDVAGTGDQLAEVDVVQYQDGHSTTEDLCYADVVADPDDFCLYDSDTAEYLDAEKLGITDDQHREIIRESIESAEWEGHVEPAVLNGRRVYTAE